MAGDYFPNRYFPHTYFADRYWQGGEQVAGAISASLSGSGTISAELTAAEVTGLILGGWSWPVDHDHSHRRRKKHREPFDGLRDEIEAIYRRVTGHVEAPAEVAEAARDVAAVVEPFVTDNRIDWRAALRVKQFEYDLAIATAAYEAALRQAIEDEEDEEWLLLAA